MARRPIRPPPYRQLAMEPLSTLEYATFAASAPLLRFLAQGDGHPVLVIPGFQHSDRDTAQLRSSLRRHGHAVHGWRLGRNSGPQPRVLDGLDRRLTELHQRYGRRRVSVVGWSLGGIYARELARANPAMVRQVITLASPFRFREGDRGNASALYDLIGPKDPFPDRDVAEDERSPLAVPATAIYTRDDGIVRWHSCIESAGPRRENIEVRGTHNGVGHNVATVLAVADRLAQPEAWWAPFRPHPAVRHLFPTPVPGWVRAASRPTAAT